MEHYDVLLYAGNFDGSSCNHLGVAAVADGIVWSGAAAFAAAPRVVWRGGPDGGVAGFARGAGRLTNVVVTNSGHLVPTDQPEAALDMITRHWRGQAYGS